MKNIMMIAILFLSITYAVSITTEVVADNKTKLEWQNEAVNKTETKSWEEAIDYCEGLILDEKEDWRLPNINELQSLVDYSKSNLAIVSTLEDTTNTNLYWSSTTYIKGTESVLMVSFYNGISYKKGKSVDNYHFRCVRDY